MSGDSLVLFLQKKAELQKKPVFRIIQINLCAVSYTHLYPIGRLDKDSEGLLLLTNEGDLVNRIMKAGNYHEKEYQVTVNKPVTEEFIRGMGCLLSTSRCV